MTTLNKELAKINETIVILHNMIMNETDTSIIRSAQTTLTTYAYKRGLVETQILELRGL